MPVASMKSGSWKGGFSMPRLPCRYFRFWLQWRGTGTLLRYDCRQHEQELRMETSHLTF